MGIDSYFYVARALDGGEPVFLLAARKHYDERIFAAINFDKGYYRFFSDNPKLAEAYALAVEALRDANVVFVNFMSHQDVMSYTGTGRSTTND